MAEYVVGAGSVRDVAADLLAVGVFRGGEAGPGAREVEEALGLRLGELMEEQRLKGELGDALLVPSVGRLPSRQVLAVALGDKEKVDGEAVRKAASVVARRAGKARKVVLAFLEALSDGRESAWAAVEGFELGSYRFEKYRTAEPAPRVEQVVLLAGSLDRTAVEEGSRRGSIYSRATYLARDLVNEPSLAKAPADLAEVARGVGERAGLAVRVLEEGDLEAGGFGGLLGVGRGSERGPRLVEMRYEPEGATGRVALVGKGITFDSGGLSLKTSEGMATMKTDMSGGAAVIAVLSVLRELGVRVAVRGIICAAENMPSGKAIRPGDVLKMRNGKTVEVLNTDAEGRLVLADGLSWAVEESPHALVDLATLTGACMVALGVKAAGLMGNDPRLVEAIKEASKLEGERVWELPLYPDYAKELESEVADLKNIGEGRYGGAIIGGLFLKEFVGDTPWAHLDIAGPARSEKDEFYLPKGGTGVGVRTLLRWLEAGAPGGREPSEG